ncbi:SO2930 family diheme c-type cytochrome [Stenotrophomonas acidaminiphila]|uniref:SO2930 family diheme c-type cytochrome n=1 Tax=Stenotrophomonas acidaminiphila TaxID=128780 RepID=UPI0028AA0A7B|nr:SO2930 family diheme c-type cytochrome [Stenotrophomonas acidaminiphila]
MPLHRPLLALAALLLAGCARAPAPEPVRFFADGQPERLAEWNVLYVADGRLRLNARVLPYDLDSALFTDYAHKLRTVWMPAGSAARYQPDGALDFPVGTIISKTFYYPRGDDGTVLRSADTGAEPDGGLTLDRVRLVETRLLVRRASGWLALPYVWNDAQTEARLMRTGDLVPLTLAGADGRRQQLDYLVPDENQCAGCHGTDLRSRQISPIGPKARHLNHDFAYASGKANQLRHWQALGQLVDVPAGTLPRNVAWNDPQAPLEARARAYLDINCGHCHSDKGAARTSGMWLDANTHDPLRIGRCKLPIAAGQGTGNRAWDIVPGVPDDSILTYRMESTDPGVMMPELGRALVHEEGVALIRQWIAAMAAQDCGA